MKFIRRTVAAILVILAAATLVMSLAFFIGDKYFLGGICSVAVSMCAQYWIPALVVFLTVCVVWAIVRKTKAACFALIMTAVALVVSGIGVFQMVEAINSVGASVDFLKSFSLYDTSSVKTEDFEYMQGVTGPLKLTVFYTDGDAAEAPSAKPVILYTHGGGWMRGSRFERSYDCKVLALAGYVVVSWDYDLSDSEVHLWDTVESEAIEAITWVRDNVAAYGGSTEHFFMIGDSAGGHLTLEVSNKINAGMYRAKDGSELPVVDAICCNYPVASPSAFWDFDGIFLGARGQVMVESYMGGTPDEKAAEIATIEPVLYASESAPPTVLIVPEGDTLVPPQASYYYVDQLKEIGATAAVVSVPHANHAYDYLPGSVGDQAFLTYVVGWFARYM